ncbi:MAG: hypothetical protein L6R45_18915 [Anaerolineae bacterium]|nr:hypothetical protein [Anaerolineae bacterium]
MAEYIETQTKNGATLKIEVESTSKVGAGFTRPSSPANVSHEGVKDAYDQTLNTVRVCANGMVETLQGLASLPNTASIDFAIKIDAEAGAMIAKSIGDAHFKVSLSWKQAEPESKDEKKS